MSLLTRCPACSTHYKLVPDQLRISQGWVKCGQCEEIFDASLNLIHAAPVPEQANDQSAPVGESVMQTDAELAVRDADAHADQDQPAYTGTVLSDADADADADAEVAAQASVPLVVADLPETDINTSIPPDAACALVDKTSDITLANLTGNTGDENLTALQDVPVSVTAPVSFLHQTDRGSLGASKLGRALLRVTALFLLSLLLIQWLYWDRDRLATAHPEFKPMLQAYCHLMNCKIQAVKRVEAVAIDTAAFNKSDPEHYRLSFTIKNLSGLTLAWPSIELTLTDIQDQVIVRRVLSPAELFVAEEDLSAGSDRSVTVLIKPDVTQVVSPIMGFRLLAFYP